MKTLKALREHTHNTFSEREILAKFAKVILAYNKLIEKEIETI